ncbi:ParB/RepB/Spo0J family partition protein [Marivibrio halodurans]|uniref:ParB/RepB/Spo0J family partition protein n=1 Tax=Marivibrio halodurans TaxID=2039722 RepID=A0A8J7V399_9PROT|nr:ParB/RepB/Spo0J family partition protein [Marivibrio halodurans]MBP5858150.1 ParB/RepB/Spo0J family partition protein [Marivibrio halodurans]
MTAEKPKKRGLGRGLDALFGESALEEAQPVSPPAASEGGGTPAAASSLTGAGGYGGATPFGAGDALDGGPRASKLVPIELIRPNPDQPRKRFDDAAIDGLVESIKSQGVLQPLLVRRDPGQANGYQIVAGERRWRAAQRAQLHEVPVLIKDLSDSDALEIALIENIHREDLTVLEEAEGYQRLMDEFGHTQEALAKGVGKSRSHVANLLRLLGLPDELKSMLDDGLISAGHARALLGHSDAVAIAHEVVKKGLNVRQTEKLAQESKPQSGMKRLKKAIAEKDPDTRALEQRLGDSLGLKVAIDLKDAESGESGKVTVHFDDFDQLDDVAARLSRGPDGSSDDTEM